MAFQKFRAQQSSRKASSIKISFEIIRIIPKCKKKSSEETRTRCVDTVRWPVDISRNSPWNPRSFRFLIVCNQLPNDKVICFQRKMYGRCVPHWNYCNGTHELRFTRKRVTDSKVRAHCCCNWYSLYPFWQLDHLILRYLSNESSLFKSNQ